MLKRLAIIVGLTLVLGGVANTVSPNRIAWVQDWSDLVTRKALDAGLGVVDLAATRDIVASGSHMIFDARRLEEYDMGHIPTALPFPEQAFDEYVDQYQMLLTPEQPILVYCSGEECDESVQLGILLRDMGFTNIDLFPGGYSAWSAPEAK